MTERTGALWNSSVARSRGLANVVLFTPMGFKQESPSQRGMAHVVEHLVATGPDLGTHFNGFTTDSAMVVYGLCHTDDSESIAATLAWRASSPWVRKRHLGREVMNVSAETAYHTHVNTDAESVVSDLGFSTSAGAVLDELDIDAVSAWMNDVAREFSIGIFDPTRSSTPQIHNHIARNVQHQIANRSVRNIQRETAGSVVTGWSFDADTLSNSARLDLALACTLVDGYLNKYGGRAQIGFSDDFKWWRGNTWALVEVPQLARVQLERSGIQTLAQLHERIQTVNPGILRQTRGRLIAGPEWLRHPVVREIVIEMSKTLNSHFTELDSVPLTKLLETSIV